MANEKRRDLIDRQDLIKAVQNKQFAISNNTHPYKAIEIQGKYFREVVDNAPTVDAVEVVHGRWISLYEYAEEIGADATKAEYPGAWVFCSECGQQMRNIAGWHYCPNCGAKMDGGNEDG